MRFGTQTAIVISITENLAVRDSFNNPELVHTETPVPGCRCRPLPATEDSKDFGDRVTDPWKLTAPPVPAIVNAKAGEKIRVDGITYSITGIPRTFNDRRGPHKTTILLSRNLG